LEKQHIGRGEEHQIHFIFAVAQEGSERFADCSKFSEQPASSILIAFALLRMER
jgi:hypothetical protein